MISDKKLSRANCKNVLDIQMDHILMHYEATKDKEKILDELKVIESFLKEKDWDAKRYFGPRGIWQNILTSKQAVSRKNVLLEIIKKNGWEEEYKKRSLLNGD